MTLATIREDGYHKDQVSYVNDNLTVYFGRATASQPAIISLAVKRSHSRLICLIRSGTKSAACQSAARRSGLPDPTEMDRVGQLMLREFLQIAQYATTGMEGIILFRITPEIISVLDHRRGFGHTELVRGLAWPDIPRAATAAFDISEIGSL